VLGDPEREIVTSDDTLYRTLFHDYVRDGRVRSSAFITNGQANPTSVYIARLAPSPDRLPKRIEKPHLGVGALSARVPLEELALAVTHEPEEGEYSHAHILNPGNKGTQRARTRILAERTTILIQPTEP
jgi:hypothetical protein